MNYKTTITAEEVIKSENPVSKVYAGGTEFIAPNGFEFTGEFREAKKGEFFLSGDEYWAKKEQAGPWDSPRLILRKIPKEKNYKFTYVRTGFPQIGEYFLWTSYLNPQCFSRASSDFIDGEQYKIYTLTEEEA